MIKFELEKSKNYIKLFGYLDNIKIPIDVYNERFPYGLYREP